MKYYISLFTFLISLTINAQAGGDAATLLHRLEKLRNTSRVLYLAAHPDDENTRMISWLENDLHMRTAYLSLTRGDGGQNLIGTELGAELGVLRTQELMQARSIDGGEQFFTRAVDFGYSKTAAETFRQWDKDQVLADVVWVIRRFQPDLIITRFPPDERAGHGHHTASAMLALEAFDLAADPKAYPEQLKYVNPWQVKRLFWNHSTWWRQNLDSIAATDDRYTIVDVGSYDPLLGVSCNELASFSRSQHKSQGFGVSISRGTSKEYLQLLKGEKVNKHLNDGIKQGWSRYGWEEGDQLLKDLIDNFDPFDPSTSVVSMMTIYGESKAINDDEVRLWFQSELSDLIALSLGLHAELVCPEEFVSKAGSQKFELQVINRGNAPVAFTGLSHSDQGYYAPEGDVLLPPNEVKSIEFTLNLPEEISQPYWLEAEYDKMFQVADQQLIGLPENPPSPLISLGFEVNGEKLAMRPKVVHKFTDRVDGEIARPVVISPAVVANLSASNLVFTSDEAQSVDLEFRVLDETNHTITFKAEGWEITPSEIVIPADARGWQNQSISIARSGKKPASELVVMLDGTQALSLTEIDYPHIEKRVIFSPARLKLVNLDLKIEGDRVGYIEGAGDMVAEGLRQMGYQVDILGKDDILNRDLSVYQAIVAGIRAYNTQEWLPEVQEKLMQYVEAGGNYIVQYNTASRDLRSGDFGPYPFSLSRERVTEEDAAVNFLLPDHKVLNEPNKLTKADFDNWVQERGLYFAGEWDEAYETPLAWHDEGEPDRAGGLIITGKGSGSFIYTGISFFRELPAGVPGAYRLLANLISYQP